MTFREYAQKSIVVLDGGMGTLLEKEGLAAGECPETWSVSHPDAIRKIHRSYYEAGSNVVNTNTFGANPLKYSDDELKKIITSAVAIADEARIEAGGENKFVALDVGPLGKLLKPFGDLSFENAYDAFSKVIKFGACEKVDLIVIETMSDLLEAKAAVLAAKDNSALPIMVTLAFGEDGKLLSGADASCAVAILEGLGVDYIGANCSLGPEMLLPVAEAMLSASETPIVLKPNAGLPEIKNGKTVYNVDECEFSESVLKAVNSGVRLVGGCCGTTPEYIKSLKEKIGSIEPKAIEKKNKTVVSSFCKAHYFGEPFSIIGESINPTGRKRVKEALGDTDFDYIASLAELQESRGAHAIDVNVGMADTDEVLMLERAVQSVQYAVAAPLVIDSSDPVAMERALRVYSGKAMINSVSGKESSMAAVFPLQKKYGGVVIALTLDEQGIPKSADQRVAIAKKILKRAEQYGIAKKDIVFDPLALTVSADKKSALETLRAIKMISCDLGAKTSLGLSNISYGLPKRDAVNSAFLSMAMAQGLSGAIMNVASSDMMRSYYSSKALLAMDEGFFEYISASDSFGCTGGEVIAKSENGNTAEIKTLREAIIKGRAETAASISKSLISSVSPMEMVENEIIPALNEVGESYENGKTYLPALLASAEGASAAFEVIKSSFPKEKRAASGNIVIATVKGDIHDIGKNIVKLLLENYGFGVVDLGKDVSEQDVLLAAEKHNADIVALSALMTTTVPAMEKTVRLVKEKMPSVKLLVGGAVMTESVALKIGADAYAKDAMGAVRYAEKIIGKK